MKYKRQKVVTTTLFNGLIEDENEIREILLSLCKYELDADLMMAGIPAIMPVRIVSVLDDHFDYKIINGPPGHGCLTKSGTFDEIIELSVISNDATVVRTKPGITRWQCISPSDFFDEDQLGK